MGIVAPARLLSRSGCSTAKPMSVCPHTLEPVTIMNTIRTTGAQQIPVSKSLRTMLKLILLGACVATGINSAISPASAEEPTFASVRKAGELRCGAALAPPFVVRDPKTGAYTGAFSDLCRKFGEDVLKVKVRFVDTTWDDMVAGLQTDKWDLAMSINRTPAREQVINFSTAVLRNDTDFVYSRSDPKLPAQIRSVADIDKPGVVIAVVQGTTDDRAITPAIRQAQILRLPDADSTRLAVISHRANLLADQSEPNLIFQAAHPDWAAIFRPDPPFNLQDVAFGLNKSYTPADLNLLNQFIEQQTKSGFVQTRVDAAVKQAAQSVKQ
jgi:polar amino acid transport system substrate-binding protein